MSKAKKRMAKSRRQLAQGGPSRSQAPLVHDGDSAPPPELIDLYIEIAEFTEASPTAAAMIAETTELHIAGIMTGIAWSDHYGYPEDECLRNAKMVKWWAVMNGFVYLFDWPEPIGTMTDERIVAQARADRGAGIIPLPKD